MSKYIHAPHTLKDTCVCGHAKETHYEGKYACLGMHCDDCHGYENASSPAPSPSTKAPPPAPSTDPILPEDDDDLDPSVAPVAPFLYPFQYQPTTAPWP